VLFARVFLQFPRYSYFEDMAKALLGLFFVQKAKKTDPFRHK